MARGKIHKLHDDKTIPHSQSALFPKKKKITIDAEFGVACQQLIADKQTLQQLSEDFANKFRIEKTDASSLEWQPKYSITELNASKHTAYFPTDRETLEKVLPKKLFIDCMGILEPIQQEGVSQTSKVAVSVRKPKKQIQVSSDEEQVEEGKRKKQQKYPSTIKRPKTKTLEGDKASATAEEASGFDIESVEEESVEEDGEKKSGEEEEEEEEKEEEEEDEEDEEEGVEDAEKGVEVEGGKLLFLLAQQELSVEFRFRQNQPRAILKRTNLKKNLMLLSLLS